MSDDYDDVYTDYQRKPRMKKDWMDEGFFAGVWILILFLLSRC